MEGPTSSLRSRNRLICLTFQEHDDDDDDDEVKEINFNTCTVSQEMWISVAQRPKNGPYHEPNKFSAHQHTHTHNSCDIHLVLYSHTDYRPFNAGLSSKHLYHKPLSNLPLSCNALVQIGPRPSQCRGLSPHTTTHPKI